MTERDKKQIGRILLEQRAVTPDDLEDGLAPRPSSRAVSTLPTANDVESLKALSEQHGVPGIDLRQVCLRLADLELLPREIAERHLIVPVLVRDDRLFVAMVNPRESRVIDELEFVTGKKVYPYVAVEGVLAETISAAYERRARGELYYVGPSCPEAVLRKLGIDADGIPVDEGLAEFPPGVGAMTPLEEPAHVVDDALDRASHVDEVEYEDFGDLSPELSVVEQHPDEAPPSSPMPDGPTVLVVDDEADIRKMLKRLLVSRGYRVLEADRGLLALRLVKEETPDLIVLDAMLPEVHGFDIARRIKNSRRYGHIPIVMVSAVYRGWRYAEDLKQSCGVAEYIEKPFRLNDVVRAVEACLSVGPPEQGPSEEEISLEAERALEAGVAAYKAGNLPDAVAHLQRGIAVDPLAYRLHFHLGLLYGKQGKIYEAIAELETAVDVNGQHFPAVKNLAILYQKAGFRNKAAEMWERGLHLAPDDETRQSIRQHLLQLL